MRVIGVVAISWVASGFLLEVWSNSGEVPNHQIHRTPEKIGLLNLREQLSRMSHRVAFRSSPSRPTWTFVGTGYAVLRADSSFDWQRT